MNGLTNDSIAIDANVLEHLLNPQENTDKHISKLLTQLHEDKICLLVDSSHRITNEYKNRLGTLLTKGKIAEGGAERILLVNWLPHWFSDVGQKVVLVKINDALMMAIKNAIPDRRGKPVTDRFYVYVAFKKGRTLVTNDRKDILENRHLLKKRTQKCRPRDADILDSQEAYDKL